MSILTSDEITKRCQDLVYQVAYAFYDSPYILCLKVLAQLEV
jgi:transcription initiation factor TFIIE subunit alpha